MTTIDDVLGARFIPGARGHLFIMLRRPPGVSSGSCVLFVPPFGEEMNKSRRAFAQTAAALASAGLATLLVDLHGTGDSQGEFRDATWAGWIEDLGTAVDWARGEGWHVDRLLAARLGCALAMAASAALPLIVDRTVFWQPVLDGKRFITQLLRMRVMASEMGGNPETVASLRSRMAAGECLEVGGYDLSPALANSIESQSGTLPANNLGHVHWFNIAREPAGQAAPATRSMPLAGAASVTTQQIAAEPFWSTIEIISPPQLVAASVSVLAGAA